MELKSSLASHDKECVKVAVNIRPLTAAELLVGSTDCITVAPGEPLVQIGSHVFTFDHIYGSTGSHCTAIFQECVAPLVDALFHGYNATVIAYGQTGSGKTYTMGTNYTGEANSSGVIPKVIETILSRIEEMKSSAEFLIRVSFIEIFKEEVFDLLEGASTTKSTPSRAPVHIRETANGGIRLAGVLEPEVRTKEEMASYLSRGSVARATGSTNMNSESSRSHAIFIITMEQKKSTGSHGTAAVNEDVGDDILCAKLHLVDLAGSERAKRTGSDGLRFKEGIHINRGLLALGNVISALGDEKKRKEGGHVPYRDSKLTRLLQDSLGGNSKTVMIACVSPADSNAEETLNTLKYANRARNIQNKAVINRDPVAAQMQRMRNQLEQLQAELLYFRGEGGTPFEELQVLRHKNSLLESSNAELQRELRERQSTCEHLANSAFEAQVEKDKLVLKIESARKWKSCDEIDCGDKNQDSDLVTKYISKIQEFVGQLLRLQNFNDTKRNDFVDCLDLEDDSLRSRHAYISTLHDFPSGGDDKEVECPGEAEVVEKELEHSSLQDKLDRELQELNKCFEQKELKKEGRRNEFEMHKPLALNQRQKMVLQRKTEEASMATKRLKELLEARKASSRAGNGNGPGIQALMQAIEHELEVVIRVHDVRTEYERQIKADDVAKEVKMLKEEAEILKQKNMSDCSQMSPGARNSRIFALENMLATSSSTLVSMASQLSEAEERECVFSGKGHWNQVRSLPEAENVMNHLFNLASSSSFFLRCLLRDKEVDCRKKDSVIRELKEKIVTLTSLVRQLEAQKEELLHKEKLRGPQNSSIFNVGRNSIELLDMDSSDSDSETCKVNEEDDEEWVPSDLETDLESERLIRKRRSRTRVSGVVASSKADSSNVCCTCRKRSLCKTVKCKCRSNGATCGTSCGCAANKCTNRKDASEETDMDASVKSKMSEGVVNTDDTEMTRVLASQGAMLLQSALDEKLADVKGDRNDIRRRKPLSDIGNIQGSL